VSVRKLDVPWISQEVATRGSYLSAFGRRRQVLRLMLISLLTNAAVGGRKVHGAAVESGCARPPSPQLHRRPSSQIAVLNTYRTVNMRSTP
jgi:hypothetical protein